jgi:hypothetical protein
MENDDDFARWLTQVHAKPDWSRPLMLLWLDDFNLSNQM